VLSKSFLAIRRQRFSLGLLDGLQQRFAV